MLYEVSESGSLCKCMQEETRSNDLATGNKSSDRKGELGETKYLEEVVKEDMGDDEVLGIFVAKDSGKDGHNTIFVSVMLDQKSCEMQLDTRATVSILRKVLYVSSLTNGPYMVPRLS